MAKDARFYYDRLGRLVVSQNGRQASKSGSIKKYSYTLYDDLGRVVEAGEKTKNTAFAEQFASVFGTQVSGLYNPNVIDDAKRLTPRRSQPIHLCFSKLQFCPLKHQVFSLKCFGGDA